MEKIMKEIIITSSALIVCIMLIRHFFRGKISNRLQYALWLLVAVRLIVPVSAQIYLSVGGMDEFRIMDLVERLEGDTGDITGRLKQPVTFALNMDSMVGRRIAENMLGDMPDMAGEDGPTSVFLAGTIGLTWLDVLRRIWFGGMAVMAVWMVAVNLRFCRKLHRERHEFRLPEEVKERLHPKVSGCLHKVRIYVVEGLSSPCLYGLPGREAVYLPKAVAEEDDRLCHVLTHEICHRRHGDGFWSILRNILLICYWFHPLAWAAAVLCRRDCELACDESALLLLGEQERIDYGKTLLAIITGRGRLSDFACTATTMTGSGKSVKERIRYIAEKPKVLGAAVAAVFVLITAASVLVFTKSPQFSGGTWNGGTIYVMTDDKRIMLPDSIAGISGYTGEEGNNKNLIIYQIASDEEVGRFCTVSYEEAEALVDAGRTVVPLGTYGKNDLLRQYMGLLTEEISQHYYFPSEQDTPGLEEDPSGDGQNTGKRSEKAPFEFDGKTEWVEDGSNRSEKKPFLFDGKTEWGQEGQAEQVEKEAGAGVAGTDSNNDDTTYIIPDETTNSDAAREESTDYLPEEAAGESVVRLPEEEIVTVRIPNDSGLTDCYIYLAADHSGVKDRYLEEMQFIDNELRAVAGNVIVTGINRGITEETFEILAAHKTQYLGDNSAVSALTGALPLPEGAVFGGIELTTGETQKKTLKIEFELTGEDMGAVGREVLFFDAAMLFATIENLDECVFAWTDEHGSEAGDAVFDRTEVTEQTGVQSLWRDLEEEELKAWLEELHQRVLLHLYEG